MSMEPRTPARGLAAEGVVEVANADGNGDFVLACEHASRQIPAEFAELGLEADALESHIAWDPGALAVARRLAESLDAPLVAARFSRLLYDCNRPPDSAGAIPAKSEIYEIPGNRSLSPAARQARVERFYLPFRNALAATLDRQQHCGRAPVLVTIHSFTPVYEGIARDLDIGILHDKDARFAEALLATMTADTEFAVRRNEPYGPQDGVTHTLRTHALGRGLLNVMIEIRNSLLNSETDQLRMADLLAACISKALTRLENKTGANRFAKSE